MLTLMLIVVRQEVGIPTHPKTMSSPYLTGSLSSGKTPSCGCEQEPREGVAWLLLQDGRSSRDGGGHRDSELPSNTMPTGHAWGSLLKRKQPVRRRSHTKGFFWTSCSSYGHVDSARPTLVGCPTSSEPVPCARTYC